MNDVIHTVGSKNIFQILARHDVRTIGHHFIDEFAPLHHGQSLFIIHQGRSLALRDALVGIDTHDEVRPERASEAKGVHVAVVHDVEGPVHENADFSGGAAAAAGDGAIGAGGGEDVFSFGGEEFFFEGVDLSELQ